MSNEPKSLPLSRSELRTRLLSKKTPKSKVIEVFGVDIELRQPTLDAILTARDTESTKERTVDMIIKYAYVPGTTELVFEEGDRQSILEWPFGEDLIKVQKAISTLTGIDVGEAKGELKKDPLDGLSSALPEN